MKIPSPDSIPATQPARAVPAGARQAAGLPDSAGAAAELASRQNSDGGWGYSTGPSWTEPTVYSALAMQAAGCTAQADRGIEWLGRVERRDGGWAPQPGVQESTWVTALVALLPRERLGADRHRRAIGWLLRITGKESTFVYRLRQRMLGHAVSADQVRQGWPWFPGAAAWVGPTALGILALRREHRRTGEAELARRIEEGRQYLYSRRCQDGGWNHGTARALGYEGRSYPETTGMALAALAGATDPGLARSLDAAGRYASVERSLDGQNWLRLGLLAHGRPLPPLPPNMAPCRNLRDRALDLLAREAAQGRNWLITV